MPSVRNILFFVGGVAVGVLATKWYAQQKIQSDVRSGLSSLGVPQSTADTIAGVLGSVAVN